MDLGEQNKANGARSSLARRLAAIPRSRWLLFAGAVLALALPYIPWVTVTVMRPCMPFSCRGSLDLTASLNPIDYFLRYSLLYQPNVSYLARFGGAIYEIVFTIIVAPGLLCSVWVSGRLRTQGQRAGIIVFTTWFLAFTIFCLYATYWIFSMLRQRIPGAITWAPSLGALLFVGVWVMLWLGLLFAWREMLRSRNRPLQSDIQRQSPLAYAGSALATLGFLVWFIGFHGVYWLLPPDCPPTPLFSEAPCNERFSAFEGYYALLSSGPSAFPSTYQVALITFWGLEVLSIFGGLALLVAFWLRRQTRTVTTGSGFWGGCLALLNGLSLWGTFRIAANVTGDVWTGGWLITLAGLTLIAAGCLIRWRATADPQTPASHPV